MDEGTMRAGKLDALQAAQAENGTRRWRGELEAQLMELDGALDRLTELLDPVLRPPHPTPAMDPEPGGPEGSELAHWLRNSARHTAGLNGRVRALLERVDL